MRKRFARKKRFVKRKAPGRWSTYFAAGKQLYKDVKMLKGLINPEFKTCETTNSGSLSSLSSSNLLNDVLRGTDYNQLTGRSVKFRSLQYYIQFQWNPSATTPARYRFAIVLDKEASNSFSATNVWSDFYSGFRNLDLRKDIVVLREGTGVVDQYHPERLVKGYLKLNMHTIYNTNQSSTIADLDADALWLCVWTDQGVNQPTYGYRCRLRFIDN